MFSVSPLRTDTDRPTPSETSAAASLAPSALAEREGVLDERAELVARIGKAGGRRRTKPRRVGHGGEGRMVTRGARLAAPRRLRAAAERARYDTDASFAAPRVDARRPSDPDAAAATDPPAANVDAEPRQRPSKTRRKQESHDLQSLGESLPSCPTTASRARCSANRSSRRSRGRAHQAPRRAAPPDAVHRQADAHGGRRADRARRCSSAQLGRARDSLALHQAERWRAELIADDGADALRRRAPAAPTCSTCAAWCATRGRSRAARPSKRSGRAYRELFQFIKRARADE